MTTSQEVSGIMVEGGAEDFEGGEKKKEYTDKTETT